MESLCIPKFFIFLRFFCWHPVVVVVVVVVVIIEEKGEIRSEYTAHRTRRTLADEGSGAEQHVAVGTWTASSCVSAQETEIWPNPEGKSGLGRKRKAPIASETTTKILQGVLCSRAGGCEEKKLESSLPDANRPNPATSRVSRPETAPVTAERHAAEFSAGEAPSNSGWCPAEAGRYTTREPDNRALWAASVIVTEVGCCSVFCGVNPPYWNLDAEEDVVRTPLSDESGGPLSVPGS